MDHLNMELDGLKQRLLTMASHAETAVNESVRALVERDYDLAVQVKDNDDVIDQLELAVDEMAIHLLAKAPLAGDLRFVMVAMKISNNLERVGDEATKIAKRARDLSEEPPVKVSNVSFAPGVKLGVPQLVSVTFGGLATFTPGGNESERVTPVRGSVLTAGLSSSSVSVDF